MTVYFCVLVWFVLLKHVTIAAIGPVTEKAIDAAGLKVAILPKRATIAEMVKAIIEKDSL